MKKLTLILALLTVFTLSYGQKFKVNTNVKPVDRVLYDYPTIQDNSFKAEGDVFYSCTFDFADPSDDRGWSYPEGWTAGEDTDNGMFWTWRAGADSVNGNYTTEPGHRFSKTPEDGYFVLPTDEYVSFLGLAGAPTAWFQMAPIDCSGKTNVVLKLRQYFRNCCSATNVKMSISVDQGVHWADYSMAFGTTLNVYCVHPNVEINISDVVAGQPDVWIKFTWADSDHYFWVIDDIELIEGYTNELQLENAYPKMTDLYDDDQDEGFVFMTPLTQINETLGGWIWQGAFVNAGAEDAYYANLKAEVWKNGTTVYEETSEQRDVWALDRDTFNIETPYFPDGYGSYMFNLTAQMEQTDGVPANNIYQDWFHVTDSIYSVSDWDFETYSSTASWTNSDGDFLGVVYDITTDVEVNSLSVFIQHRLERPQASTQPGYGFMYHIFYYEEDEGLWVDLITSEWTVVEEEMLNTWLTLPLEKDGESEFLTPGQYIAAIEVYHNGGEDPDNNVYRFTIGSDTDHQYSNNKTLWRPFNEEVWYQNSTDLSMIRMNLNYTGAPIEGTVVFNVDMNIPITNGYFHPEWGNTVDMAGSVNGWSGSEAMTDTDGDGIYTLTISGVPVFENIEYKYRINANWDTSEFPAGGPNRVYRTHYYNVTDDVYNDGIAMSVPATNLTSSMKVYPNPTDGIFTLDVENRTVTDLNISVSNIQGQVVYQNHVKSVMSHSETIDLTTFANGMYFLKVNDNVTKLLVK